MKHLDFTIAATLLLLASACHANVITVDDDGPADYDTIQAAVDAASDGDEVVVSPGVYTSTQDGHVVDMKGKFIRLRSTHGSGATVIDGQMARRGIVCLHDQSSCTNSFQIKTFVLGFTITGGFAAEHDYDNDGLIEDWERSGGGMLVRYSCPALNDCVFVGNSTCCSESHGAGMSNWHSAPELINCDFMDNHACLQQSGSCSGGGMYNIDSDPMLTDCTFTGNTAAQDGGGMYNKQSSPTLSNCTFTGCCQVVPARSFLDLGGTLYEPWCDDCRSNVDCIAGVEAPDLSMTLSAWGSRDEQCDINGDGSVNALDIAFVLAGWGPCR